MLTLNAQSSPFLFDSARVQDVSEAEVLFKASSSVLQKCDLIRQAE